MPILNIETRDVKPLLPNVSDQRLSILIDDVFARAVGYVPSLGEDMSNQQVAIATAILRRVIVRLAESGSGGTTQKSISAGPYSQSETYETRERKLFYPDEIEELRSIFPDVYANHGSGKAFSIDLGVSRNTPLSPYDVGWVVTDVLPH